MTVSAIILQALTTATEGATGGLGDQLPYWSVIPFVGLLLCIAILPLTAHHWFEQNKNRGLVAAVFGIPVLVYLTVAFGHDAIVPIEHVSVEYVQFIMLLAALFTISGGIYITGNLLGTPWTNVTFFAIGAVLANFIGTTGAAMVLIRPLLRANSERKHNRHVVIFFIFTVCNAGGLLTPLGDPPLFLGFLRGIDFFWTFGLWPQWLLTNSLIIIAFLGFEAHYYRKEKVADLLHDLEDYVPLGIAGKINLLYLAGVIAAVIASPQLLELGERIHFIFLREVIMLVMVILSLKAAPTGPRKANHFEWGPIQEVAILFAGIFATMIPALAILQAKGDLLPLRSPVHYFWATGILSSFLDNAPTYLTFLSTSQGFLGIDKVPGLMSDELVAAADVAPSMFLAAISCGAVFMGANSYIGNAPNFMVKAIAEKSGIKMPSFFGYMVYAALVLVPIFALVTWVFFV